ncbi:NAD(P)/FAD-dependent oxidoreductase [Kitasatospora sp. YST-16]|uniref:protoporphyrinogen/coproporphyrinogen oxidase n=1 Tax=Kitasatospora sp. YST-16 TaxID=2998080 RepID=UPI0022841ED1|nr:NAD(P)/FAD-dependent oxidoreductase [Kitasatospora sp. YST-16]WAL70899.1 NAD(P)/FAD-dependent oxidoreductase [Kitasatospora sp. YST-16]WNW36936.1 NAD(P)/FAD-dependent oxidoreductase [Streptomyces sp. Li-HN-5-13]
MGTEDGWDAAGGSGEVDVAVVGAGIAGLAAAHHLVAAGRSVRVFEGGDRIGGRMASSRVDGWLLDEGAETIAGAGYEATWELIRAVGVPESEVPVIEPGFALWRHGRAHAHLGHPKGLLTGAGLSWRGRWAWLRFVAELGTAWRGFDPDRPETAPSRDATLSEYCAGSAGREELLAAMLQPLSSHCFGWRPESSAVAPMVATLLSVGGAGARWMTYRDGMDTLARRLAERLPVELGRRVTAVREEPGPGAAGVRVEFADGTRVRARQVVLAVPAPLALELRGDDLPDGERPYLAASTYAPMLKVACLLDRPLPSPTGAPSYAMSVPESESRVCTGLILDHLKADGRAPAGKGLVSVFASPWVSPELLGEPDERVVETLCAEAERFLPGLRAATVRTLVHRFPLGLPQGAPAAVRERAAFLDRPTRAVEYAGDWMMLRPSSEGAVRSGKLAAERVLAHAAGAGAGAGAGAASVSVSAPTSVSASVGRA